MGLTQNSHGSFTREYYRRINIAKKVDSKFLNTASALKLRGSLS